MALHHPTEVTGLGRPKHNAPRRSRRAFERPTNPPHGCDEFLTFPVVQRSQNRVNRLRLQSVELREFPPPLGRQREDSTTPITLGLLADDKTGRNEGRQDAAEVAGVEIELAPQVRRRNILAVGQLEHHPGFGEAESRTGEFGPQ